MIRMVFIFLIIFSSQCFSGVISSTSSVTGTVTVTDGSGPLTVDGTVAVTGAGDASAANQTTGNALLTSIDGKLPALDSGRVPVSLPPGGSGLTDTELRATAVPVSIASMPSTPVTGTFWQATQPVSIATAPVLVAGSAIIGKVGIDQSTPGTTNKVAITGNAGGAVDAANNATAPANVVIAGAQLQSGATATAGTAGQVGSIVAGLDHVQYARLGGPVVWSCFKTAITATTECKAAAGAGLTHYVTSMSCSNQAATVQGVDVVYGTGAACVTGITALTHKYQFGTLQLTTNGMQINQTYLTPLVPAAAAAICIRPTAATAFGCTLTGYTAP